MKKWFAFLVFAIVLVGLQACSSKEKCPTYSMEQTPSNRV